ncbi:MAG: hypothetical protein IKN04_18300 [Clostridia bacterium]|nr:hypothetical protein [Clostridia bacterium]
MIVTTTCGGPGKARNYHEYLISSPDEVGSLPTSQTEPPNNTSTGSLPPRKT